MAPKKEKTGDQELQTPKTEITTETPITKEESGVKKITINPQSTVFVDKPTNESQPTDGEQDDKDLKNLRKLIPLTSKESKNVWMRVLAFARPVAQDIPQDVFNEYRNKIKENMASEKLKKEQLRYKQKQEKDKQKELISRSDGLHRAQSMSAVTEDSAKTGLTLVRVRSNTHATIDVELGNTVEGSELSQFLAKQDITLEGLRGQALKQVLITSHFAAQDAKDKIRNDKGERKRKISQLYEGDVYHHSLKSYYARQEKSKFYEILNQETRRKYFITPEIRQKLEKIEDRRQRKKEMEGLKRSMSVRFKYWLASMARKSILGQVLLATPRYYRMKPDLPTYCRRCRYPLKTTLEVHWTPVGVAFCILLPCIGFLCCHAYREWVCVICQEVYVYGDYPSRVKPKEKSRSAESTVTIKKTSILKRRTFHLEDDY